MAATGCTYCTWCNCVVQVHMQYWALSLCHYCTEALGVDQFVLEVMGGFCCNVYFIYALQSNYESILCAGDNHSSTKINHECSEAMLNLKHPEIPRDQIAIYSQHHKAQHNVVHSLWVCRFSPFHFSNQPYI